MDYIKNEPHSAQNGPDDFSLKKFKGTLISS